MIGLKRLEYFVVLAEELNFRRAAERLFIAQPGLSQQIGVLESEIGAKLFHRDTRGVRLTEAGAAMRFEASKILDQVARSVTLVRAVDAGLVGQLRVAHTRSAPALGSHEVLEAYVSAHPNIEAVSETGWTSNNLEMLARNEVDVAFVRPPIEYNSDIGVRVVSTEEVVAVLPPGHPLATRTLLTTNDVANEAVVQWRREQAPGYRDAINRQVWPDHDPVIVAEEPDAERLVVAVGRGLGIALVGAERLRGLNTSGVVVRHFERPVPTAELAVAWSISRASALVLRFIDFCEREFAPSHEPK